MKFYRISIFMMVFLVVGSFSGISAVMVGENSDDLVVTPDINAEGTSKIIYVAKNGTDKNDGLTPEKAKRNIQRALEAASPGDTIKIGPGTYTDLPVEISKNVTLQGTAQNSTIIDGQSQANRCIRVHSGVNATINDITLKNSKIQNNPTNPNHRNSGGGIYNDGILTINRLTIVNCSAKHGGGIINKGIMELNEVIVKDNTARDFGGGIYNENTMLINNSFVTENKVEGFGGGIQNNWILTVINTTISLNNANVDDGGGINGWGPLTIMDSLITKNLAFRNGGGIKAGNVDIVRSVICNNAAGDGGGISVNKAYVDDETVISGNKPNNCSGTIIPA